MSDAKSAWNEAAGRLGALGGKVKQHYAQQHRHEGEPGQPGPGQPGPGQPGPGQPGPATEPTSRVNDTASKLAQAAKDAAAAIGAAAKDPAVKDDVRHVGQSLAGALRATSREVSDQAQKARARRAEGGSASTRPAGPPAGTWADATDDLPPEEPPKPPAV